MSTHGYQIPACLDGADTNDDGAVDIGDSLYLLQELFANGPGIPPPSPDCGVDQTSDGLDCVEYSPCTLGPRKAHDATPEEP